MWKTEDIEFVENVTFRLQFNYELNEFRVAVEEDYKHNEDRTYYTSSSTDALDTLRSMVDEEHHNRNKKAWNVVCERLCSRQ